MNDVKDHLDGLDMYSWAKELFPICRSITGKGVRQTLIFISKIIPSLEIKSVKSGECAFDWIVPNEWNVEEAFIEDENGNRLIDFKNNNLHLVGYSIPVDEWLELSEIELHLHSLEDKPDTIPYVTSYYKKDWGFCLTQRQRDMLPKSGKLHVVIKSTLEAGQLNYGELVIPGRSKEEIFFSTYICHPSMANNELSGPVVATALARWVGAMDNRRYTYRFIFIPETIGSIIYLSKNSEHLKKHTIAGYNLTCVGDDRAYSYLPSISGDTLSDSVAIYVLDSNKILYTKYSFLERGSDERQYCWPGIDLPICSVMRSKYNTYDEYHTSDDNMTIISPRGLAGSLQFYKECISTLEQNYRYKNIIKCEPQMGQRGLYPTTSDLRGKRFSRSLIDFMVYCDGKRSVLDIAKIMNQPIKDICNIVETLLKNHLIEVI